MALHAHLGRRAAGPGVRPPLRQPDRPEGGVRAIDFGFIGGKWANPFWQVWDLLLLWLALLHGGNGMRTIIDDYAERTGVRFWLKIALFVAVAFTILLGTMVIFTFEPCPAGADPELLASFCTAS